MKLFKEMDKFYFNRIRLSDEELIDTINSFHLVLQSYDTGLVLSNFYNHVKTSQHPPTIADLVKKPDEDICRPYIPNAEETKQRYLELEYNPNPISPEDLEEVKKKIEKSIKEAKKANEQRIAKLFEQ